MKQTKIHIQSKMQSGKITKLGRIKKGRGAEGGAEGDNVMIFTMAGVRQFCISVLALVAVKMLFCLIAPCGARYRGSRKGM